LVDLWLWPVLAPAAEREVYRGILSPEELARAERFVFPHLAERFIVAHGRMRQILARALDTDPASLRLTTNPHGKPELTESDLHFSLSHSGDLAALALAGFPLGVDIEVLRPVSRELPERFFSRPERDGLRNLREPDWTPAFFRCWTRKEAVVKALGLGLSFPLDGFDVSFLESEPARVTRLAGEPSAAQHWQLHHIGVSADCVGAIAARQTGWSVRERNGA